MLESGKHLFVLGLAGLHGELVGLAVEGGIPVGKGEQEEEGAKEKREAERALEHSAHALGDHRRALAAQLLLHLLPTQRRLRLCSTDKASASGKAHPVSAQSRQKDTGQAPCKVSIKLLVKCALATCRKLPQGGDCLMPARFSHVARL